jgi:pyruvate kinase
MMNISHRRGRITYTIRETRGGNTKISRTCSDEDKSVFIPTEMLESLIRERAQERLKEALSEFTDRIFRRPRP